MLSLAELAQYVLEYRNGKIGLAPFQDWFEDHSSAGHADPELRAAWQAVDGALSQFHYDQIGEDALKEELATVLLPFFSLENHSGPLAINPVAESTTVMAFQSFSSANA